jgi:hypothetical protein
VKRKMLTNRLEVAIERLPDKHRVWGPGLTICPTTLAFHLEVGLGSRKAHLVRWASPWVEHPANRGPKRPPENGASERITRDWSLDDLLADIDVNGWGWPNE